MSIVVLLSLNFISIWTRKKIVQNSSHFSSSSQFALRVRYQFTAGNQSRSLFKSRSRGAYMGHTIHFENIPGHSSPFPVTRRQCTRIWRFHGDDLA